MAEAIFRVLVSDRLKVAPADLAKQGIRVSSAGVACYLGSSISTHSVEALRRLGMSPPVEHRSTPIGAREVEAASDIFVMTPSHLTQLLSSFPEAKSKARLLRRDGGGIPDPIGGSLDDYLSCATAMVAELEAIIPEMIEEVQA